MEGDDAIVDVNPKLSLHIIYRTNPRVSFGAVFSFLYRHFLEVYPAGYVRAPFTRDALSSTRAGSMSCPECFRGSPRITAFQPYRRYVHRRSMMWSASPSLPALVNGSRDDSVDGGMVSSQKGEVSSDPPSQQLLYLHEQNVGWRTKRGSR